jgi:hypothetical protein
LGFALFTGVLAAVTDMAIGALAGVVGHHLWERSFTRRSRESGG